MIPGTRLGPYEVLSLLGAGGMGEVYRAKDSTLKREVALKVLPADVAKDRERLARFQREAEVLASLNHPHIAQIYGLEQAGDTFALVMELVEGEDLAQRIARGPIPLDEAVPIARQIAEALEAAHEHGIIHRDLKPANIKVRADGTVKVLDFGLAKAIDPTAGSSATAMNSPTLSIHATAAGIILGTVAYMSPEQAAGKSVDKRSDLWAFGAVLFEMLTGRQAFAGDTLSHVIAAVLKDEPDWAALPVDTPGSIRRLLRRCLEKDRRSRLADAADARLELVDVREPTVVAASSPWSRVLPSPTITTPAMTQAGMILGTAAYMSPEQTRGKPVDKRAVLPASVASDADRLARFQREAEVLAALNHPNIGAIYGLEKTPDFTALVMELVEGEDLSQRIAPGAIPIEELLPIARQIAEALEAAHEQGIVHRDLKPANIKVRADGTVKVLDFGLAKAMEPAAGSSPSVSMSPTMMSPAQMSGVGVILGTAAYMAPEQAKGRTVDKRADIWAFGVVVYEMLTGRRLFAAEDVSETLAAVLTRTVDLTALPAATPPRVQRLLARCLDRDPRMRLRDIGEARVEIEKAIVGEGTAGSAPPTNPESRTTNPVRALAWIVVAALVILALAVPAALYFRRAAPERNLTRLELATPPTSDHSSMALSSDGRQIAFVAASDAGSKLWVRRFDQAAGTALPGTDGAAYPFWAPDGRAIGFFADGKVKRADLSGGAPQALADASAGRGGTWSAGGVILFAPTANSGLMRIHDTAGAPAAVTALKAGENSHRWPRSSCPTAIISCSAWRSGGRKRAAPTSARSTAARRRAYCRMKQRPSLRHRTCCWSCGKAC